MHKLIRVIVTADTKEDATSKAEQVCDNLIERSSTLDYDWYSLRDGRWDESGKVYAINSAKGKELLTEGFKFQKQAFDESIKNVRTMLEKLTDEQIWSGEYDRKDFDFYAERYQFSKVYDGDEYIFGEDAEVIDKPETLEKYYKTANYLVPVDIHY